MNNDTITFVMEAVAMVAEHGWKLLPQVMIVEHYMRTCDTKIFVYSTSLILNQASFYITLIGLKKSVTG